MANEDVSVDLVGMAQAREHMSNAAGAFRGHLSTASAEVQTLLSTWTGQAANRFGGAMQAWSDDVGVIIKALEHMVAAMSSNASTYHSSEQDAEAAVGQWGTGLNGI